MHRIHRAAIVGVVAISVVGGASAAILDNDLVAIRGGAPEFNNNAFENVFALDQFDGDGINDFTPDYRQTDYASNSQGDNTFLDFGFPAALTFTEVRVTDRVTSGIAQGACCGGNLDMVTNFDLVFSNDPTFASPIMTLSGSRSAPSGPTSPAAFETIISVPNVTARYIRYDVTGVATSGSNAGAADFQFDVTSVPTNLPFFNRLNNPIVTNAATPFAAAYSADRVVDESTPSEYASQSLGADTFVDFDFGAPATIGGIIYQDRAVDNITGLNLIFSQNSTFGDGDDVVLFYQPEAPGAVNQINFADLGQAAGVTAQFVRFDVTSVIGGTNIGFREVEFFAPIPEPGSLALLGVVGIPLLARRRRA